MAFSALVCHLLSRPIPVPVGVLDLREALGSVPQQRGRFIQWSPSKSPPSLRHTHTHIHTGSHSIKQSHCHGHTLIIQPLIISYTRLRN